MTLPTYTFGLTELNSEANKFVDNFISKMLNQNIITTEQAKEMTQYRLVIARKGFFGKVWDRILFKKCPDATQIFVVKLLEVQEEPADEPTTTPE